MSVATLFGSLGLQSGYVAHAEGSAATGPVLLTAYEMSLVEANVAREPVDNSVVVTRFADAADLASVSALGDDRRSKRQQQRAEQAAATARKVDSLLTSKRFLFVPSRVVTQLPGTPYVTLTTYYEVAVTPDSVACTLPYYGYVYNTISNPDRSPFYFVSANPEISQRGVASGKERAWVTVTAREKFNQRVYVLNFEVFDSGEASLTIQGTGTQHLQFLGNIEPIPAGQPTAINPEIL